MISEPEDYGLSDDETLAHTAAARPPREFDAYWRETREAIETIPDTLLGTVDGPINELAIESWRSVRIIGRLSMPDREHLPLRGIVITSHGYEADEAFPSDPEPWTAIGLATFRLRVRGYPPSTLDVDDLREGWILRGIESPEAWILRGAVVDVIQAYRGLRRRFGPRVPIAIHGESFGGGLAVIAAAQLAAMGDPPCRLAIALPSFGDWRWRSGRYCNGSGGQINTFLNQMRDEARRIMRTLLLFDAAIHARAVRVPVLCKLALRDDVVPAPSAAAVFNALESNEKSRFITQYGHFDGGIADGRRHVEFERLHPRFLDPSRPPAETLAGMQPDPPSSREFGAGQPKI